MPTYEQGLAGSVWPDATYEFECVDAGEKESAQTHNTMIELQLDVLNSDFTDKIRVVDRLVFTPSSYWKIDSFRKATGEKITEGKKVSFEAEDCVGRKGRLQLKTTSYNNKARNEVDYYLEPEEGQSGPMSAFAPPAQPAPKGTVPKDRQPF